ncbi:MAG: M15 family metallopeptidase [Leptolyngbyaceae cyanobacterium SL_5_9]|nr:M15 family metallopeptidase [Leptolyngbyaceae cyanobacterium SL_5_9]
MNNAGSPRKPPGLSAHGDDIPEALRETPTAPKPKPTRSGWRLFWWGFIGFAIALIAGGLAAWLTQPIGSSSFAGGTPVPLQAGLQAALAPVGIQSPDLLLGHLPYEEAPETELAPITADGSVQLRQAAAERFTAMSNAARAEGINLVAISGFRTVEDQQYLFFGIQAEQGQASTERAEVSAPPGYSEHHTGYAVDVADSSQPETDLEVSFENTPGFKWLKENAAYFNFELSFPKDNPQGVSYEPWHWRFVGDRHSLETFYKARTPTARLGS